MIYFSFSLQHSSHGEKDATNIICDQQNPFETKAEINLRFIIDII